MYLKCAHPECSADFDYGQGRFFRFQQFPRHDPLPANSHGVKHFWLCPRCCETFTIDYQKGVGVILRQRFEALSVGQPSHFILQDESGVDRRLTVRPSRTRTRTRKKEILHGQTNTIEILENRNLERRGYPK
jgi:hypothetical protein